MRSKKVWRELLEIAKSYYDEDKIFYSKTKRGIYKIKSFSKDKIVIKKLSGKLDEVLGKKRFIENWDKLIYGIEWNISPAIKSFLKLHPKIVEDEKGNLVYKE
ncbi:hypothetical protein [Methanocaldococcus sp.]|uniref:hypothetical protein n=1 Tax=Methanocaldococcus sp. TaxID=2152917 RepID=UPI0026348498|nr:hypothetical protein [Methanocaldococcus sp.]MCQ6253452.1 hypothetical protein [Methanocaldococcus sp.]